MSTPAVAGRIPIIAIVGRPNVGKSALFNRLTGQRKALVEEEPGTTRDRLYATISWLRRSIRLVDTGGVAAPPGSGYAAEVREQVLRAMAEADLLLFLVDARDGLTSADREVAAMLREFPGPVLLVANKADNPERAEAAVEFFELGMGEPRPISVQHGRGIDGLMDDAVAVLPPPQEERAQAAEAATPVAIVGRPNVGKSMLLNRLVGEERVIVSEVPGTTRDAVDVLIDYRGSRVLLVDTAGVRRRGHVEPGVEKHSVLRTEAAIERAEVVILVVDADEPFTAQDLHVAGEALEAAKGIVVAVNKWDLVAGRPAAAQIPELGKMRLRFAPWIPIVTISAKEGTGIDRLMQTVLQVAEERQKRVPTPELSAVVRRAVTEKPAVLPGGKPFKVLFCTQARGTPPTFVLFVNRAEGLHFSYRRYLENVVRRAFGFHGTAIRLVFRSRGEGAIEE